MLLYAATSETWTKHFFVSLSVFFLKCLIWTKSYIYINSLSCYMLILGLMCAEQLARCWARNCCRWPRCWTRRQMNLRAPQETRSSLTPSLIYRSFPDHLCFLNFERFYFSVHSFSLYISLLLALSIFYSGKIHSRSIPRRWQFHSFLCSVVMALGVATVRQAGAGMVADEGAKVVWFLLYLCFIFASAIAFVVKIRLVFLIVTSLDSCLSQLRLWVSL